MNRLFNIPDGAEQWLINLIELKNKHPDISIGQIADSERLAEKSITNVFCGKSKRPSADLISKIIHALGGTWSEIFGETGALIGGQDIIALQNEVDRLTVENAALIAEKEALIADKAVLESKVESYRNKIDALKDEIIDVHKHYIGLGKNI